MKNKNIFACFLLSITFIGRILLSSTLNSYAETTTINPIESNLSAFFELPLNEIENILNSDVSQKDERQISIMIHISKEQIQKQLADLEPQKEAIATWQTTFNKAYFDLLFEKLHLTGIYDVTDPEYLNTVLPSAWIEETDPFTLVDFDGDEDALCLVEFGYYNDVSMVYNNETITMTPYEAAQRTLYVIKTYGDTEYFTSASDNLRGKYINNAVNSGDATCDNKVDVSDAVLIARFIAEDSEAIMTDQGKSNADINNDGDITHDDVTWILKKIAKMI